MEREILFRGKRLNGDGWVYGDLSYHVHDGEVYVFPGDGYDSPDRYEVDPATVGQYTGLTDRNGVKIFEGDILCDDEPEDPSGEYLPVFGRVCFGEYHNTFNGGDGAHIGFFVEWEGNEDDDYSKTFRKDLGYWVKYPHCDVRGNIHDNPELLGGNE